jgi:hypothetical protein
MNTTELSWMAGFFEGEGSVGIVKRRGVQVQMDNTERNLLETFQKEFGGVIVISHWTARSLRWKWRIVSRMALRFTLALFPYVHGDKTKAKFQRVFDFYGVTPNNDEVAKTHLTIARVSLG